LSFADEQRLQNEHGDACTAVEISQAPQPQPTPGGCGKVMSDWLPPALNRMLQSS
jgi:hypothetical protein